ncbi:MAG: hypothetical protein IPK70_02090 [Flavobacteriales bacterium]|nr:hypothetical protein [Flavobacteriales bacterium]
MTERRGLVFGEVHPLRFDAQGAFWVGTAMGLNRYNGSRFAIWTVADSLPAPRVHDIALDSTGALWFGTANGLARRDPRTRWFQGWAIASVASAGASHGSEPDAKANPRRM